MFFKKKEPSFYLSMRFFMGILLFFGYCLNYMQKIDMSISIVVRVSFKEFLTLPLSVLNPFFFKQCMVNQTALNKMARTEMFAEGQNFTNSSNKTNAPTCGSVSSHSTKKHVNKSIYLCILSVVKKKSYIFQIK